MLNTRKKVILLGAKYVAVGVIKAFAGVGIPIVLLFVEPDDPGCHSRFISKRIRIPNPVYDGDKLLHFLMESKEDWDGALLIPTQDEYILFISKHRIELEKRYVFSVRDWDSTRKILNKNLLYPQAQALGIPTPQVFFPDSVQFLTDMEPELFFPCILKPHETHKFNLVYRRKVFVIHDFQELIDKYIDIQENKLNAMVSEIIPGEDSTLFTYRSYIDSQGTLLAEMCTQKLRQYPVGFGQGALVRTIPMIEEIRQYALKLLTSQSYQGESAAEFRKDPRDNQYKLMEINIRPVLTELLFVKAGLNFPYLTYLDLVENIRVKSPTYSNDFYWIHNYWELVYFVNSLKSGDLNFREFLKPFLGKKVFMVPFFEDPIHYFYVTYLNIRKYLKRLKKHHIDRLWVGN